MRKTSKIDEGGREGLQSTNRTAVNKLGRMMFQLEKQGAASNNLRRIGVTMIFSTVFCKEGPNIG